jgi:hypothetical protein
MRKWYWCPSKEQYTYEEVCQNNLAKEKCIHTKLGCRVKPKEMLEEAKVLLRSRYAKRGRPSKDDSLKGKRTPELCEKIKKLGIKKAAIMLYLEDKKNGKGKPIRDISESAVRAWIYRETVPPEYYEAVQAL